MPRNISRAIRDESRSGGKRVEMDYDGICGEVQTRGGCCVGTFADGKARKNMRKKKR